MVAELRDAEPGVDAKNTLMPSPRSFRRQLSMKHAQRRLGAPIDGRLKENPLSRQAPRGDERQVQETGEGEQRNEVKGSDSVRREVDVVGASEAGRRRREKGARTCIVDEHVDAVSAGLDGLNGVSGELVRFHVNQQHLDGVDRRWIVCY
ncbi:hypothetical protein BBO_05619 [Beauveria brongniartii RCEF 3172]|uniref:Uncharacterized protein n=1 Tax=Beauveria brongniartii RCEF 3172 TaxID=1081107 RepID=A0A162JER7_9HYPO|nr:hypothetical protein BBO_05619 [Beauveria brongniartii RCEF 3172]